MYKVKVIAEITYKDFNKCKNIVRATDKCEEGHLHTGDIFEIENEEDYNYLAGNNSLNIKAVELIEISIHKEENKEKSDKSTKNKKQVSKKPNKIQE